MARDRSNIKVTASDALEFEPVESAVPRPKRRGLKLTVAVLVVTGIGVTGWVVYGEHLMRVLGGGADEVVLIRAEEGPIKVRPENPGGLQVPNRDKLVYNRLDSSTDQAPAVERLLPRPEAPLPMPMPKSPATRASSQPQSQPRSLTPAPDHPATARVPALADVKAVNPPPPPPAPPGAPIKLGNRTQPLKLQKSTASKTAAAKTALRSTPPPPPAVPAAKVTPAAPPPAMDKPTTAATPPRTLPADSKVYRVQLAAARTPEAARAEWDRVRRKNLDLLGDLGLTVTKVDLGPKKGVFYRLRVGPLANDAAARKLCKDLAKRRIGCLVIKPGA